MKKFILMMAGFFLLCMSAIPMQVAQGIKSKVVGKWEISVPDAPVEFQKFTATVKVKDGEVFIDFKNDDVDLKDRKFTEKDGKLTATLYVGESVQIVIWEEKDEIKGTAETSMGKLAIKFKKIPN